jgi:aryl-alcohol dehydrogenase-like predicted oxidoreductase/predicted CoA-binding protein
MVQCTLAPGSNDNDDVKSLLNNAKTIAVVGVSHKEERDSNKVFRYLRDHGYRVIPVNPKYKEVLGETCYPDLKSIPEHVDVVDIFRNVEVIPAIVDEAIEVAAGAVWMQLHLVHEEAAQKARSAGLCVVMNRCMKIEHSALAGSNAERIRFGNTDLQVSPLVLGTWVTGGWAWGGSDEKEALAAILRALELGVNFIDTAPVYGFGKSELIVGKALKEWGREKVVVATKCGLEWDEKERIRRNAAPERILREVDDSLKRLGVDYIDLYQIHWPDPAVPFEASMETLLKVRESGKIRYIGVSNFDRNQIQQCMRHGTLYSLQPPYNMFEREAEKELLPFCLENGIATLAYGGLCRGLLSGKFKGSESFPRGDLRRADPKFKPDQFKKYVSAVDEIKPIAASYGKSPAQFALRWAIQQPGITCVIAGSRTPKQAEDNAGVFGWTIKPDDLKKVDEILAAKIPEPLTPDFMAPKKD